MYQKYHTDALILGSREYGEADRVYALYTKEFGLIHARAQSVREERSRMRGALLHYARANVSLVHGKRGWKIVGAVGRATPTIGHTDAFSRIAQLVTRLVQGEERNEYLFLTLSEAHTHFLTGMFSVPAIELVCVARVLFSLGYLSSEACSATLFAHTAYTVEHLEEAERIRHTLVLNVNRAIVESQL